MDKKSLQVASIFYFLNKLILKQIIPRDFSRKYLKKLEGTTRLRVGEDMAIEVKLTKSSTVTTGWKKFSKKYNLQVGDVCKFVMTQREPLLFTIIITRAREEPSSKRLKLQGLFFFIKFF